MRKQRQRLSTFHSVAALFLAGALVVWIGAMAVALSAARLAPEESGKVVVLFAPGGSAEETFGAIVAAGGKPVRPVAADFLWVAQSDEPGFVGRLRAHGARAVFGELSWGPTLAGCFALTPQGRPPSNANALR